MRRGTIRAANEVRYPLQTAYPLGPPTVTGRTINVDTMLNQPTRITRMISDLALQKFLIAELFTNAGGVSGGAVIFDMPLDNDLYSTRDVQRVQPAQEFPIITSDVGAPQVAEVEKWGGKVFITDEARERNDSSTFTRELRKLTNTIIRKLNQRAVEVFNAVFGAYPGQIIPGHAWSTVNLGGVSPTPPAQTPAGDLALIQLHVEQQETGIEHDSLLMNPLQVMQLQMIYQDKWEDVLRAYGYTSWFSSNRVQAGNVYSLASGQVGQVRTEKPLGTETWREPRREITWVQASVRPLMFVDNPWAVVLLTVT